MMLISQGSSGSDRGLLQAVQAILAAFRPEVKAFPTENRLVAPTVQQILRCGMAGVETEDDYLSPKAHPKVFDQANVWLDRMMRLAYALKASAAPPRARLSVAASEPSQGLFAAIMDEKLFATPDAAAYLWRGGGRTRVFQLSAAGSRDANGRPLTYLWRIIRGDPTKISIKRSSANAETIELSVDWHDQTNSLGGLKSSRIDIAFFAYNGVAYSAPAFFSLAFPGHQTRTYPEDASDGRPLSITYGPTPRGVYFDPVLWPLRNWTDEFTYTDGGQLTGWTRIYKRGRKVDFSRDGLMVHSRDDAGRPLDAERITYQIKRPKGIRMVMTETRTGQKFRYEYTGLNDVIGRAVASN